MAAVLKPDVPAAETPEAPGPPAADVAARIERAAALARLNEPAPIPVVPSDDDAPEPTYSPVPTVPMIPRSKAFSGVTHVWAGGGEPFRVIVPSFPWIVDGLYQVANFGDVVVIDPRAADFGLQFDSIEPID
jgi:hypothetical protein